jgi:hypothetical protein
MASLATLCPGSGEKTAGRSSSAQRLQDKPDFPVTQTECVRRPRPPVQMLLVGTGGHSPSFTTTRMDWWRGRPRQGCRLC